MFDILWVSRVMQKLRTAHLERKFQFFKEIIPHLDSNYYYYYYYSM
jgi:hypothetical protein